jgi:hypothetical protein
VKPHGVIGVVLVLGIVLGALVLSLDQDRRVRSAVGQDPVAEPESERPGGSLPSPGLGRVVPCSAEGVCESPNKQGHRLVRPGDRCPEDEFCKYADAPDFTWCAGICPKLPPDVSPTPTSPILDAMIVCGPDGGHVAVSRGSADTAWTVTVEWRPLPPEFMCL